MTGMKFKKEEGNLAILRGPVFNVESFTTHLQLKKVSRPYHAVGLILWNSGAESPFNAP